MGVRYKQLRLTKEWFLPQARHVGSSGNPLSNVSVKIIVNGQEVPDGKV